MDLLAVAGAVLLVICGAVLAFAARSVRTSRRRAALAAQRSRDEVAALTARVEQLSGDIDRVRRGHGDQRPEYVITTLGTPPPDRDAAAGHLQRRLVTAIRRGTADRPAEQVLVAAAVRSVAVCHGVRRALSPDNRERIAWAARRTARESRRARRLELRDARREVRARRLAAARRDAA